MRARLSFVAAAAACAALLAPASASATVCKEARVNGVGGVIACYDANPGLSGTTASPTVGAMACPWALDPTLWACSWDGPATVGATGVTPGATPAPTITIKPSVSAKMDDTQVATLWVDGNGTPVIVPGFCVGSSTVC